MKRVLVTGPVERMAEYSAAARAAGWEAVEIQLLRVIARRFEPSDLGRERFDWICLTSASAISWLEEALLARPLLRDTPCAVVGKHTVERAAAAGLALGLEPSVDSAALAAVLRARSRPGDRVLWPRGSLSDELARSLRDGGFHVEDPIAYATETLPRREPLPGGRAVFFASPSAVRAWHEIESEADPRIAIAIGRTTFDALLEETQTRFFDTISLPEPTPEAFGIVLAHLDVEMPP